MNKRSGRESQKNILRAALKVFSKKGYAGASMRNIAAEAGISVGGVYVYFRNKEELYLNLLSERIDEKNRLVKSLIASVPSPTAALSEFIDLHFYYARMNRSLILMHIRELGLEFAIDIKRRFFREQAGLLAIILKNGIGRGEFRKCNPLETAKVIMVMLRGAVLSIAMKDGQDFRISELKEFILYGIARKNARKKTESRKGAV